MKLSIVTLLSFINLITFSQSSYTKVPNKDKEEVERNNEGNFNSQSAKKVILPPKNDGLGIAYVERINGVDVYCMNTPLTAYIKSGTNGNLLSNLDVKSIIFGGLSRSSTSDKMNKLVNSALKEAEKQSESFDAIIYSGGKNVLAITYEIDRIPARSMAKVRKINNVYLYAFCEPAREDFEIRKEAKSKSGGFTSVATYGLVNSSIEDDLKKMIERLDGNKKKKIDAVIYSSGKKGIGIKFND